jgi:aminoglycoside phosphotransferase (APT) family kinase protein
MVDLSLDRGRACRTRADREPVRVRGEPTPGAHNFDRGGVLATYDDEARTAIAQLDGKIDGAAAAAVWGAALATEWQTAPVWIHGDISPGNLLVRGGRLSAVIDFGLCAVGDPACDFAIAWTTFDDESRDAFRAVLATDAQTWARARGWALWKAMIVAAGIAQTNALEARQAWRTIDAVLMNHRREA